MDTIFIRGLIFSGRHGVGAAERSQPQRFGVDLEVTQQPADWQDRIKNTYDYMHAHDVIRKYVEESSFKLIETLAEKIIEEVLAQPTVVSVSVTIKKLDLFVHGEGGVTIVRSKNTPAL